jgi:hypothetical protein
LPPSAPSPPLATPPVTISRSSPAFAHIGKLLIETYF